MKQCDEVHWTMLGTCGLGGGFLSHSDPGLKLPGQGRWLNVPAQDHRPTTHQAAQQPSMAGEELALFTYTGWGGP